MVTISKGKLSTDSRCQEKYRLLLSVDEIPLCDVSSMEGLIKHLESERDKMKAGGNLNMQAINDYRKKTIEYKEKIKELDQATDLRNTAKSSYDELRRQRLNEFMTGFGTITLNLKEMYQMITLGGDAELELADSTDPFAEGIIFSVRPPKKSWKNISNLSGGEKTLSSLALVFALHVYRPTPIYVMDGLMQH